MSGILPGVKTRAVPRTEWDPSQASSEQAGEPDVIFDGDQLQEAWQVEIIQDSVLDSEGRLYYQVAWTGWPPDPTWYPASNFKYCPAKLQEFHAVWPTKPGPPGCLELWHQDYVKREVPPSYERGDFL